MIARRATITDETTQWHHAEVFSVRATFLAVALALVAGLAAQTHVLLPVLATVFVAQVVIASSPAPADERGRGIPSPHFSAVIVASAVSAAVAYEPALLFGANTRASLDSLRPAVFAGVLPGIAAGLVTAIVAQARRKDGRSDLVRSLAAVTSLVVFAACASAWVAAGRATTGPDVVTLVGAALAVSLAVTVVPGRRLVVVSAALVLGAGASLAAAYFLADTATLAFAAPVGFVAAGFGLIGLAVGSVWTHGRHHLPTAWGLPGALAFALAGPLAYVVGDFLAAAG